MQRMNQKRSRHFIGYLVVGFAIVVGVLYGLSQSFREEVNEAATVIYVHFVLNPTMGMVADKTANVPYCGAENRLQKLDVYTPSYMDGPTPVVLYIHGGSWSNGSKVNHYVADFGAEIVRSGMSFVSVNYRLAPASKYPAQNDDITCALGYLQSHAHRLNIDTSRIALMGDSAGGQLAAMAAFTSPRAQSVKAVVEFYGPSDIWAQITRTPRADKGAINYIGSRDNRTLADRASPLRTVAARRPAFLLFHGVNDRIVHYDQSTNFANKLRQANVEVTLVPVQNANHHFDDRSQPTARDIKQQTVTFLKQHLF